MKRKPSLKQLATMQDLLENPGKPVSKAMLDNGYAPGMAKNPQELTESVAWKDLMERHFSDEKIALKIEEGLEATQLKNSVKLPDYAVRHKYVETTLKLKGRLKDKEEPREPIKIDINFLLNKIYGTVEPGSS